MDENFVGWLAQIDAPEIWIGPAQNLDHTTLGQHPILLPSVTRTGCLFRSSTAAKAHRILPPTPQLLPMMSRSVTAMVLGPLRPLLFRLSTNLPHSYLGRSFSTGEPKGALTTWGMLPLALIPHLAPVSIPLATQGRYRLLQCRRCRLPALTSRTHLVPDSALSLLLLLSMPTSFAPLPHIDMFHLPFLWCAPGFLSFLS